MAELGQFKIRLPDVWNRNWEEVIAEAEGLERRLFWFLARTARMLSDLPEVQANPERIAWLSLWTKTFEMLDAAANAIGRSSVYVPRILARSSLEVFLHASTICQPLSNIYASKPRAFTDKKKDRWARHAINEAADRLKAYAAWCLWQDLKLCEDFLRPETVEAVWDSKVAKSIYEDPFSLEAHESLFGPLEAETDETRLLEGKAQFERQFTSEKSEIRSWLDTAELKPWQDRLTQLKRKRKDDSFFAVLSEDEQSLYSRLAATRLSVAYHVYRSGSLAIHGSSIQQSIWLYDGEATPWIGDIRDEKHDLLAMVGSNCISVALMLQSLKDVVWTN